MLIVFVGILAFVGLYVNSNYDNKKETMDAFCKLECKDYTK